MEKLLVVGNVSLCICLSLSIVFLNIVALWD